MNLSNDNSTVERRSKILTLLDDQGQVGVQELSEIFKVSAVTIRNDLTRLERKNLLFRTRGGAIKQRKVATDLMISTKAHTNLEQKRRIGKKAAELIQDGDTIILDSGTTTLEIARRLERFQDLTIITHALNVALELAGHKNVTLIMPGGFCRSKSLSFVGSQAEKNLRDYYCDKLFLGVDGFDTSYGITTPSVSEASLNRIMMEISRETIVVTDSSKFGERSLAFIAPLNMVHKVITDNAITANDRNKLLSQNISLITA